MFDFLSFIIYFFLICLLVIIIFIGVKFFHSLVTAGQPNNSYSEEVDNQLRENSREASQADLYMTEENPDDSTLMFPEEFGDDW
jgi:hypothetical protein